jgi:hypothetical protein
MVRRHGPLLPRRAAAETYAGVIARHRRLMAGVSGEAPASTEVAVEAQP